MPFSYTTEIPFVHIPPVGTLNHTGHRRLVWTKLLGRAWFPLEFWVGGCLKVCWRFHSPTEGNRGRLAMKIMIFRPSEMAFPGILEILSYYSSIQRRISCRMYFTYETKKPFRCHFRGNEEIFWVIIFSPNRRLSRYWRRTSPGAGFYWESCSV